MKVELVWSTFTGLLQGPNALLPQKSTMICFMLLNYMESMNEFIKHQFSFLYMQLDILFVLVVITFITQSKNDIMPN